eukprot:6221081-Pyramimonas_sp.AAC.1
MSITRAVKSPTAYYVSTLVRLPVLFLPEDRKQALLLRLLLNVRLATVAGAVPPCLAPAHEFDRRRAKVFRTWLQSW